MRYRIMDSHDRPAGPLRRLRVPVALAAAFVGSSAVISMWYGGCHSNPPDPPDAGTIEAERDAAVHADAGSVDATPDDAGIPDALIDARPDTPPV
jgi:hypothetical protein